jgi:hypothetical protein
MEFEWDEEKACANERKHRVSFFEPPRCSAMITHRAWPIPITRMMSNDGCCLALRQAKGLSWCHTPNEVTRFGSFQRDQ